MHREMGRPSTISVDNMQKKVENKLGERSNDSNTFKVKHMKEIMVEKVKEKAKSDGLDPNSIKCVASTEWAKTQMIVVAAGSDLSFSNKKLLKKTASRFRSEHSVMCGFSYALTALTTQYLIGRQPSWMSDIDMANLSIPVMDTINMVKKAFGVDDIYPANPNLVLSSDDTTIFAFEGKSIEGGDGDWEWKLIDAGDSNSGVRSDFEVGDDAGMSGGLRVRSKFTFTASGLAAPPYVAISGLTADELSPELCEDGILAAKVPGLCKGGDDLHNNGYGWLVFLRSDKRDPAANPDSIHLTAANKKFIHYNDKVLRPFIQ